MKKILPVLLLLLTTNLAFAIQENKKIDLKSAIDLALKTNPQLKLAQLDVDISRNKVLSANRLQNPSLVFFQNIPKAGLSNPNNLGVDYVVEILKRGKRKETMKTYTLIASDSQKFLEHELIAEIKKSYINLLVKKSHLKIIKEQEELSKELYETLQKEADEGKIPITEAIQAKIVLNRAIMYTNIAKSEVISAQNDFNSVMNTSDINYDTKEDYLTCDYDVLMAISPDDSNISYEKIKNYALLNRFDLQMAKKEVEAARKGLEEVKAQRIPDLELSGGYAYQTKGMSDDGRFQSGGYAGVSLVNIPILYNFKPEIQNAEIEIQKAELKYKDMEIDATRNIADAWEKYQMARNNLVLYNEKLLSDSKELMATSKKSLDSKEIDLASFLISKRVYLELILGYQDTLGEYYSSFADLLKEINAGSLDFEVL